MNLKLRTLMLSAVVLLASGSPALAASDPIPGIDIIVKKKPGPGIVATVVSDERGLFSVAVGEPGRFTVSSACPAKRPRCPAHRISVRVSGKLLQVGPSGSYAFAIAKGESAVITGLVQAATPQK